MLIAGWFAIRAIWPSPASVYLLAFVVVLLALDFISNALKALLFRYEQTATHLSSTTGILQRSRNEIALARVQRIGVHQSFAQRLCNTGTLDFAAADGLPVVWSWVAQPDKVAANIRAAVQAASSANNHPLTPMHAHRTFRTIGLVGGIGAGKSAVARILSELGYVVLDADKDAKAALDLPHVREELERWWGKEILDTAGKADRKRIAAIVFASEVERKRLESLVHPIVISKRAESIATARREGKAGVVIDAPLLFEAGSDKDCDVVMFVDAPRAQRVARVAERGWSESELTRREAAQLPLHEKRRRAAVVIENDGDLAALRERVMSAVNRLA